MTFVFGSNTAGIHGAGAAKYALKFCGAIWGVGFGHCGDSFAIPTKSAQLRTLPIPVIRDYVNEFLKYARANPSINFKITRIGCGLAGYTDAEIAPLFIHAPDNCVFDTAWKPYLRASFIYWGTM